jgi:hypothetical protein
MKNLFPVILMILDLGASIVCFSLSDIRRGVYWLAAAILTASVTF